MALEWILNLYSNVGNLIFWQFTSNKTEYTSWRAYSERPRKLCQHTTCWSCCISYSLERNCSFSNCYFPSCLGTFVLKLLSLPCNTSLLAPFHPWLSQVKCYLLKEDFPEPSWLDHFSYYWLTVLRTALS